MRLSTRTHAALDVATVGLALALPRLLGASDRFTKAATTLAIGKIGYSLLTRHELGIVRLLPMKAHLALDTLAGTALCALPFVLDEEENEAVTACAIGLGLFDIVAAPLTDTRSMPPRIPGITAGPVTELPAESQRTGTIPRDRRLPQASVLDSLRLAMGVAAPTVAMGPIIRRPQIMALAEPLRFAANAVRLLQRLRGKYGSGPLMVRLPLRYQAVLLDPRHVRRVLAESPEPFATASVEKQAALSHFEPKMALVSHGAERAERRRLNEQALEHHRPIHSHAERLLTIVDAEAEELLRTVHAVGELRWEAFFEAWFRIVRRVIFGDAARDDRRVTDLMTRLRADANWAFLKPVRTDLRDELHARIGEYLERAEPGSLAAYIASKVQSNAGAPENQIPQWLFAFDPAAMATFRALALLAAHPQELKRVRDEASEGLASARPHRPRLRAAVLESLRLWPTTPLLLRQTTRETEWESGIMPAHTSILIYAPFFHRDETRVPFAHTFHPQVWLEDGPEVTGDPPGAWPFVPFSGGPAACPGRNLVLMLTSGMLAAMIGQREVRLTGRQRLRPGELPGTLDHFTLRFEIGSPSGAVPRAGVPAH